MENDSDSEEEQTIPPYRVGDHVTDREEDEEKPMLVAAIPGHTAREYRVEGANKTVAELNPEYPKADEVVEVVFVQRTNNDLDGLKRYAYPSSRLKARNRIHPTEEGAARSENRSGQQTLSGDNS